MRSKGLKIGVRTGFVSQNKIAGLRYGCSIAYNVVRSCDSMNELVAYGSIPIPIGSLAVVNP